MIGSDELFLGSYIPWRQSRIAKIISLFGEPFFKNKTILELGCGYGYLGLHFTNLGARVTFAEGNAGYLPKIQELNPTSEVIHLDQDTDWFLDRHFDIILHTGVLYHLTHWERDLRRSLQHTNLVILESEVANTDGYLSEQRAEAGYDQSIYQYGTLMSAPEIERQLRKLNCTFTRHDDADLNTSFHRYDWQIDTTLPRHICGYRRFWVVRKQI